jgi:hypothetical protein
MSYIEQKGTMPLHLNLLGRVRVSNNFLICITGFQDETFG